MEEFEPMGGHPPPPAGAEAADATAGPGPATEAVNTEQDVDILLQQNEDSLHENAPLPMRDDRGSSAGYAIV
eukprot:6002049-Alexandrium_andersonii.AAC.1